MAKVSPPDDFSTNESVRKVWISKKQSLKLIFKEFSEKSTVHGIGAITSSTGKIRRVLWSALFITSLIWSIYMTYEAISYFTQGHTRTSMKLINSEDLPFPSVTICNLNNIRASKVKAYLLAENRTAEERDKTYSKIIMMNNAHQVLRNNEARTSENTLSGETLRELKRNLSHTIEDMIVNSTSYGGCLYRDKLRCSPKSFKPINTQAGRCYTFNHDDSTRLSTDQTGRKGGLKLLLNVQTEDYTSIYYLGKGFRVLAHEPGEYPLVEDLGFGIPPGSHVFAAITKKIIYRDFSDESQIELREKMKYLQGYNYTRAACVYNCEIKEIVDNCGCIPYYLDHDSFRPCGFTKYYGYCIPSLLKKSSVKRIRECRKNCKQEKLSVEYDVQISFSSVPNQAVVGILQSVHEQKGQNGSDFENFMRNNLVQLDMYYKVMQYVKIEEIYKMTINDLIGNIGGNSGLWLGMSILTIVEVIDLIITMIITLLSKN